MIQRTKFILDNLAWIQHVEPFIRSVPSAPTSFVLTTLSDKEFEDFLEEFTFLQKLIESFRGHITSTIPELCEWYQTDIRMLSAQRNPLSKKVQILRTGLWLICWHHNRVLFSGYEFERWLANDSKALYQLATKAPAIMQKREIGVLSDVSEGAYLYSVSAMGMYESDYYLQYLLLALAPQYWLKVSCMIGLEAHNTIIQKILKIRFKVSSSKLFPIGVCPEYLKGDYLADLAYSKKIPYEMIFNSK